MSKARMRLDRCSRHPYGYCTRDSTPDCKPASALLETVASRPPASGSMFVGTVSRSVIVFPASTVPAAATVSMRCVRLMGISAVTASASRCPAPVNVALSRNFAVPSAVARSLNLTSVGPVGTVWVCVMAPSIVSGPSMDIVNDACPEAPVWFCSTAPASKVSPGVTNRGTAGCTMNGWRISTVVVAPPKSSAPDVATAKMRYVVSDCGRVNPIVAVALAATCTAPAQWASTRKSVRNVGTSLLP